MRLFSSLILLVLFAMVAPTLADGPCVGDSRCTVCTDCSRCAHCSREGNICGVCSGGRSELIPAHRELYLDSLSVLEADQKVDMAILSITKQLSDSEITVAEAHDLIGRIEAMYRSQIFALNLKENFQGRTLLAQTIGQRHRKYILSTLEDPDGVLDNPEVRSQMAMVTVSNLFFDLSGSQMKRLDLLHEGLGVELQSGIEAARPIYTQQLHWAKKYQEARSAMDRIIANPD